MRNFTKAYELTRNRTARCQRAFRHLCNWASRAVDQPSPSHRRNADDTNGRELDRPSRRRHSVRVAVATGFAIRRVKRCTKSRNANHELRNNVEAGHFTGHSRGTLTYDSFSSPTDPHPSSLRVRTKSARKISIARETPAPPAAPSP